MRAYGPDDFNEVLKIYGSFDQTVLVPSKELFLYFFDLGTQKNDQKMLDWVDSETKRLGISLRSRDEEELLDSWDDNSKSPGNSE
jgi:hypothetical protein